MEKWIPVALVAMLLIGGGGAYFVASSMYNSQLTSLQGQLIASQQETYSLNASNQSLSQEKAALQTSLEQLQADYDSLQRTYTTLQTEYATLSAQYDTLSTSVDTGFASLSADYVQLQRKYDDLSTLITTKIGGTPGDTQILNYFKTLTLAVRSLNSTLWEYCNEVDSFKNTLTTAEVLKVEAAVKDAIGSSTDLWASYQRIHEFVTTNIDYVYDVEIPYINSWSTLDINGIEYLTDFDFATNQNYVQTPEWTLQWKQGDCDDQAALEYAMLRYYNKYVQGVDFNIYLTELDFGDGSSHVTVFIPVTGGNLAILDPAGNYITKTGLAIDSKPAASELETYNLHWSTNSGITKITLYSIDMKDGSYTKVSEGTQMQVAAFLSTG